VLQQHQSCPAVVVVVDGASLAERRRDVRSVRRRPVTAIPIPFKAPAQSLQIGGIAIGHTGNRGQAEHAGERLGVRPEEGIDEAGVDERLR